jgi:hypothetical protein
MGGIYETERMLKHVEQCAVCKAATKFADRCDVCSDMYKDVVDFECGEGPLRGQAGRRDVRGMRRAGAARR